MTEGRVGAGFGVLLLRNNMILLGKRNDDAQKADSALHGEGTWTMPGGKLNFHEGFVDGAKREVLEETGIKLKDVDVISLHNNMVHDAHFVTIGLFCEKFIGEAQVLEPDEITEWRWFNINELPEPIYFPSAKILENYKRKMFYIKE